uniref:Uncharacterized protein n=1 Tax=Cannabis sativa TaxID=3483 RepID=A0A803P099_CANSA
MSSAVSMEARKLEAQLDEQMNSYRKLVSSKDSTKIEAKDNDLESGIDRLLKQLQQVNSQMQAWVSSAGSEMVSHTLTRHQEILQDLTQEFYRLRSSLRAKKEHASLLDGFREFDRTRLDLEEGGVSAEQGLLKEHASISRSTGQMDTVISQAQATLGSLVMQRSTFGGINSKLSNIGSRLPTSYLQIPLPCDANRQCYGSLGIQVHSSMIHKPSSSSSSFYHHQQNQPKTAIMMSPSSTGSPSTTSNSQFYGYNHPNGCLRSQQPAVGRLQIPETFCGDQTSPGGFLMSPPSGGPASFEFGRQRYSPVSRSDRDDLEEIGGFWWNKTKQDDKLQKLDLSLKL